MRQWFIHPGSVVLIVVAAISLRLAVGAWFETRLPPGRQFEFGDSEGYWVLGQTIAAGEEYQYQSPDARVFRMPGYPAVLAPIFLLFGANASPIWGRALSAVLGGVTAALMVGWGALLFDLRTGLIAGWITAFYPGALAMGSFVLSEAPFMPLMVAHLALATAAFKATSTRNGVLLCVAAGLAAAGAIYMRPSWLLFPPLALMMGMVLSRHRWRIASQSAIVVATICICLTPWWIRNFQVTGHFVATTLQVGASLHDGLNPRADGRSNMELTEREELELARRSPTFFEHFVSGDAIGTNFRRSEYDTDKAFRSMALEWSIAHPLPVIHLVGIKFSRMWNVIPNEAMFRSWPMKLLVAVTFTPLFLLGCFGAIKFSRLGWPCWLAGLPVLYFTLLHVIFVASVRYREPAMLGLIVLASGLIAQWLGKSENVASKPLIAGG